MYADGAAVFQTTRRGNKIKPQRLTGDWSKEEGKPLPETELCVHIADVGVVLKNT